MKKILISITLMFAVLISINAQGQQVSGTVTDADSGESIPGVNVVIKGTTNGVVTDFDGKYTLKSVNENDVLTFTFVGYENQTVPVKGKSVINVKLKTQSTELDELVVVGYGSVRKSDLTGSVATVKTQDLQQTTNTDITSSLQSRVSGVLIQANEGSPGAGMSIQVRGSSSLNANTEPLYVIDGFPIEMEPLGINTGIDGPQPSALSNIDPNNIQSIEILKDASATAIYGARGANGVILITTKGGKAGKTKMTFDASYGLQKVSKKLDLLDSRGFAEYHYLREGENPESPFANYEAYASPDTTNTNWQNELYGVGKVQNYSLGVQGGNKNTQFSINGGYFKHDGIVDNNTFERYSSDVKINTQVTDKLKAEFSIRLGHTITDGVATGGGSTPKASGIVRQILRTSPLRPTDYTIEVAEAEGNDEVELNELTNPNMFVDEVTNLNNTTRIIGNFALTYTILKGLDYKIKVGTSHNNVKYEAFYPTSTGRGRFTNGLGIAGQNQSRNWVHESILTYNTKFGEDHRLTAMGAFTTEGNYADKLEARNTQFEYESLGTSFIGVGTEPLIPFTSKEKNSLMSYLGRINYSYKNRYLLTASFRADGSSRFGDDNKWGYFPSGSVAWRVTEEDFLKDNKVISNLKIRTSYGRTGNQRIGNYQSIAAFSVENYTFDQTTNAGVVYGRVANPGLKWETTDQYDAGFDLGLFDNKLMVTVDAYYKKTTDMLMKVPTPITSGFNKYMTNIGSMENKGLEIALNGAIINKKDFTWSSNFNISFNRNKVLSLGQDQEYMAVNGYSRVIVGQPVGIFYGFVQEGIIANEEELSLYTKGGSFKKKVKVGQRKYADLNPSSSTYDENGNPTKIIIDDNDRTIIGKYEPKFFGGFSNSLSYKNLSMDILLSFKYGGDVFNGNRYNLEGFLHQHNRLATVLNYWDPETNPESMMPVPGAQDMGSAIDTWIEDASYLRISAVTLNYKLPKQWVNHLGFASARFFIKGENLYTFTNYSGYDPEVNMGGSLSPGYDFGAYPRSRTISVGLNVQL
ncbi:TonB-dependent receptor [Puteibacter caeruleilacunae]|nr:TonB-dependent receptor [Puteibacter caeruleilacunae]